MLEVGLVNGKILPIHWFEEDGQPVSVNGEKYFDLLEDTVWPAVRNTHTYLIRSSGFSKVVLQATVRTKL